MTERGYMSPAAFRRALTDRLRDVEKKSRWKLPQLRRQFAYDRLLQRLYRVDRGWIVKGAAALLARDLGVRGTIDIDVYRDTARDAAEADLRNAAAADLGDWFRFEIDPGQAVGDEAPGVRLPVKAYIGTTEWASFHVDLVGSELRMTGVPDVVRPLASLAMPGVEQGEYRAYPLVDHIADKIVATFQRYGPPQAPSTRYKDLVDLVAMSVTFPSTPAHSSRHSRQRQGGAPSHCHSASACRTAGCGRRATQPKRGAPCWTAAGLSTRPSRSSHSSRPHSSMALRGGDGFPKNVRGDHDRVRQDASSATRVSGGVAGLRGRRLQRADDRVMCRILPAGRTAGAGL